MKIRLLVLFVGLLSISAFSQNEQPVFKQSKEFPAFALLQVNKTILTPAKIKKNVPTVIIYFSPGCEHCLHQMDSMMKRSADLKKYQFVMATYQPIEELVDFNRKYQLTKHSNFYTGRDTNYYLPPFYQIRNFPYMAFYDKTGKLLSTFEGNMSVDDMIKRFNKHI